MAKASPEQVAADWAAKLGAAGDKMRRGAESVTVAPGQLAARQRQVWLQNVQQSADKWARNVASVSATEWQQDYINKGIPRVATGAQQAQNKFAAFMGQLLPYIDTGKANLPARGGFEANKARLIRWIDYMHSFRKPAGPGGM